MNKVLVVVDMQNDFIDGALGTPETQKIVEPIADFICNWEGRVIFTQDTHEYNYLTTNEGKHLPVEHCVKETAGWCLNDRLRKIAYANIERVAVLPKSNFGASPSELNRLLYKPDEIYICGVCTDICVVSNALIIKALFPETPIYVLSSLCAGTTPENHEAALKVMRSCQIEVIE